MNSLYLTPFCSSELLHLIYTKLKNKKSCGVDDIPNFLIRKVIDNIIDPLTYLMNMSFERGCFPSNLKVGKIIPIFKKKDPTLIENYRPVTVPSVFSKIFEYAFLDRLLSFLNKFNIVTENQHGFRSNKSTTTAMLAFYNQIIEYLEAVECPVGIFCDLSRAFDCVNHKILLQILQNCGMRGVALNWISSFLKDRKQYVSLTNRENNSLRIVNSDLMNVNMGVPQGSVLGPMLFILYTNNINACIKHLEYVAYADDISVLISTKKPDELAAKSATLIEDISNYFNSLDLYFNTDKTNLIRFSTTGTVQNITLNVDNVSINAKRDSIRFLGILVDEKLDWKSHCNQLVSKLHSLKFLFNNLRAMLEVHQLVMVYFAQVDSRLRYGLCLWGNSTNMSKVFIAQKIILRCIARISQRESCRHYFKEFGILPLPSLFILEMCIYVYNNKKMFIPIENLHQYNTRQVGELLISFCRLKVSSNAPNYLGPKLFNKLPHHIKEATNINIFKRRLKNFLLERCFYSLNEFFEFPFNC